MRQRFAFLGQALSSLGWGLSLPISMGLVACGGSDQETDASSGREGAPDHREQNESSEEEDGLEIEAMAKPESETDCEREIRLEAVTLGEPGPFDLIIVADHSDSLSWSREELSSGLRDLLTHVEGRSVRVFLLTPTQYGASSAAAQMPLLGESVVGWQDPATGAPYENAMTEYTQACVDPAGQPIECPSSEGKTPYQADGTWTFVMPEPIAVLEPDSSASEFAAQGQAVTDAILALEGGGSPEEQPLCTLSRYISQDPAVLPEHAVFLLLSDEDDTSTPEQCLASFHAELDVVENGTTVVACEEDCDAYRYTMEADRHWQRLDFSCAAFDDVGTLVAGTEMSSSLHEATQPTCDGFPVGPCTAEETARAEGFCDTGKQLVACVRQCSSSVIRCEVDLPDATIDACSAGFVLEGSEHANAAAYCSSRNPNVVWRDCTGFGGITRQTQEYSTGTHGTMSLMTGDSTRHIGDYFRMRALSVFGEGNFLLEAIVLDPAFDCELHPGQSYATNLVEFVADRNHVFPLCESYSPALDGVYDFAQRLVETDFPLALEAGETVSSVWMLAADGTERALRDDEYDYDASAAVLHLERSAFGPRDTSLRVEVTSDCIPNLR